MIIRITHNSKGIEHYLETAQMKGRDLDRNQLDDRVHLSGDMNAFSFATKYSREHKEWKHHYEHITVGFDFDESESVSNEKMEQLTKEILAYYYPQHNVNNLIHFCEAHLPRHQSSVDKKTGEVIQRKKHFHLAVAKYDPRTDKQVRMKPYNKVADNAFQSYLCNKYDLVNPNDRQRTQKVSREDIIDRYKDESISKQTKVTDLRKIFSDALKDIETVEDAKAVLKSFEFVTNVDFKNQKSGNKYLQVSTSLSSRKINLRGKGFENLEQLYYSKDEYEQRLKDGKSKNANPSGTQEELKKIWKKNREWFVKEEKRNRPKQKDADKLKANHKKYNEAFNQFTRQQKQYYMFYQNNVTHEIVDDFSFYKNTNNNVLHNRNLNITIIDNPNRIALKLPSDKESRIKGIRLSLQIAKDKGWDLNNMNVNGTQRFKDEVNRQITLMQKESEDLKELTRPGKDIEKPLNAVDDALQRAKQEQEQQAKKEHINDLKTKLNASALLEYAREHLGVMSEHYEVTEDNKLNDTRTKNAPRNNIDFLTKTCNIPFKDSLAILNALKDAERPQKIKTGKDVGLGIGMHKVSDSALSDDFEAHQDLDFSKVREQKRSDTQTQDEKDVLK